MDEIEEWRSIAGFKDYEVSNLGRVKSLAREVGIIRPCRVPERILSSVKKDGYVSVSLKKSGERLVYASVHRLVAIAFLDKPRGKNEVIHIDCDKTNNAASNLAWSTRRGTQQHAANHGTFSPELNPRMAKKLTVGKVRRIRKEAAAGESQRAIAVRFDISHTMVGRIVQRKAWRGRGVCLG